MLNGHDNGCGSGNNFAVAAVVVAAVVVFVVALAA